VRTPHITLRLVTIQGDPILDALFWQTVPSHEVVINVIEALVPGVNSPPLQLNKLITETAPKAGLAVTTDPTIVKCRLDMLVLLLVCIYQVFLKYLSSIECSRTRASFWTFFITAPGFEVKMLGIFVSFPVIFGTESLIPVYKRAAVRAIMSFHAEIGQDVTENVRPGS
jgi:hypothetical protein